MRVPEEVIRSVAEETGFSMETVRQIAEAIPERIVERAAKITGIVEQWLCFRCLTCIGPVRRIFYCLLCSVSRLKA